MARALLAAREAMRGRDRAFAFLLVLGACGGPIVERTAVSAEGDERPTRRHVELEWPAAEGADGLSDPAPTRAREPPAPRVEAPRPTFDHAATPCFVGTEAPLFARAPHRAAGGSLVTTLRASVRIDRDPIEVAPGTTLRLEAAIENVGQRPVALDADTIERLGRLLVRGVAAEWSERLRSPSALRAETELAPGAVLRLCARVAVPARPIEAAPPGEPSRGYWIEWPSLDRQTGEPARLRIVVRHAAHLEAPIAREPESWGGVIRLRLAPRASITTIARESGVRIGSGVPLIGRADRDHVFVEAPPDRRVLDTVLALAARADVLSASPVLVGDPGTEGCSAHRPCPEGYECCATSRGPAGCYPRSCPR